MKATKDKVIELITAVRQSTSGTVQTYRMGCCYQFHLILKAVFPEATAWYDGSHVWTLMCGKYFDVGGEFELSPDVELIEVVPGSPLAESLYKNAWPDERTGFYGDARMMCLPSYKWPDGNIRRPKPVTHINKQ